HHTVLQPASLAVTDAVQRRQSPGGEAPRGLENRADEIGRQMGKGGKGDESREIGELFQAEADILEWGPVAIHLSDAKGHPAWNLQNSNLQIRLQVWIFCSDRRRGGRDGCHAV